MFFRAFQFRCLYQGVWVKMKNRRLKEYFQAFGPFAKE
jgi:hypothetical protein